MAHAFAKTMFSDAAKQFQQEHGSRASYERLAQSGPSHDELSISEQTFIAARDSFYLSTVTPDGWPYVQHRGGPAGFLHVLDGKTLAFADFAGNKQYISAGNITVNDRVALFLMDYPNQTRLKLIGHASLIDTAADQDLTRLVTPAAYRAKIERIITIKLTAFDWNCDQHITPRYTADEVQAVFARREAPSAG
jgi:predicted pyridoxine 5'-phosphate oxidase superfamily flavin-nucleotide-binding protein